MSNASWLTILYKIIGKPCIRIIVYDQITIMILVMLLTKIEIWSYLSYEVTISNKGKIMCRVHRLINLWLCTTFTFTVDLFLSQSWLYGNSNINIFYLIDATMHYLLDLFSSKLDYVKYDRSYRIVN